MQAGDEAAAGNRSRVSPQAASIPSTSENTVTIEATSSEFRTARIAWLSLDAWSYQRVVNPSTAAR